MNNVDILIYASYLHVIGGIETFVVNYIELMRERYTVGLMCPHLDENMKRRLQERVTVFPDNSFVQCHTLLMSRMMDRIPNNIVYNKTIRMCHSMNISPAWQIRDEHDELVHVSKASKESFNSSGHVIHNALFRDDRKALLLVSATRIPATDKGQNLERMVKLARMLRDKGIKFLWFYFSDRPMSSPPPGMIHAGTEYDLQPYIAKADYLILLSDHEGFGYCILEALINSTAVVCTPFETASEIGVKDGKNGYIVPYDLDFDVTKLLDVPKFSFTWNNDKLRDKWVKLIGDPEPIADKVGVEVIVEYKDIVLDRVLLRGQRLTMASERAAELVGKGLVKVIG